MKENVWSQVDPKDAKILVFTTQVNEMKYKFDTKGAYVTPSGSLTTGGEQRKRISCIEA